eukprot:gene3828-biopygen8368
MKRFGRKDGRTDTRTDDLPFPAWACRKYKLFRLGDPSVAFARSPCTESGRATDAPRTRQSEPPWDRARCRLDLQKRIYKVNMGKL